LLLGRFSSYRPANGEVTALPLPPHGAGGHRRARERRAAEVFTTHELHEYQDADAPDALNFGWNATVHAFILRDVEDDAALLSRAALASAASSPGLRVSNRGGYHSGTRWLHHLCHSKRADVASASRRLLHAIGCAIQLAEAHARGGDSNRDAYREEWEPHDAWCNVVGDGHYHGLHDHEAAVWSGVYYASVPASVGGASGALVLRTATSVMHGSHGAVGGEWCTFAPFTPQPGALVIFPGWLPHAVLPLEDGEGGVRISISFNQGHV
jgi:uncharacterized protein (TIGR02466 family)